jgi:hypothetical protein
MNDRITIKGRDAAFGRLYRAAEGLAGPCGPRSP